MKIDRITLTDAQHTRDLGHKLAEFVGIMPSLIFLYGEMGAGKTTCAQGFIEALAHVAHISSPTYSYMNQYDYVVPLLHFDLFRIEDPETLHELGLDLFLTDETAIRLVEWPERLGPLAITPNIEIHLRTVDHMREAVIKYHER